MRTSRFLAIRFLAFGMVWACLSACSSDAKKDPAASGAAVFSVLDDYKMYQAEVEYPIDPYEAWRQLFKQPRKLEDLEPLLSERLSSLPLADRWELAFGIPYDQEKIVAILALRANLTVEMPMGEPQQGTVSHVRYVDDVNEADTDEVYSQLFIYEGEVWKPYADRILSEGRVIEDGARDHGILLDRSRIAEDWRYLETAPSRRRQN